MYFNQLVRVLQTMRTLPNLNEESLREWHSYNNAISFLRDARINDVPILINGRGFFTYSLIVPSKRLKGNYRQDLLDWNFMPEFGYGYGFGYSKNGKVQKQVYGLVADTRIPLLNGTIPIIFERYFDGYENQKNYDEINPQVSHILDIHWVEERQAWCKLNNVGEILPVVIDHREEELHCCTIRREELDFCLFLYDAVLIQVFEFNRFIKGRVPNDLFEENTHVDETNEIYAKRSVYGSKNDSERMSFFRGFQIIRRSSSQEKMLLRLQGRELRDYATFIIHDWKNNRVTEWTSNPDQLGNYYQSSDLPFTTSPAFFGPGVLTQYRQDPIRFKISDDRLECRGSWSLHFGITADKQVFAYIYHLSRLPYSEQLRWKAFNEEPKGNIPEHNYRRDFLGEWAEAPYDPLVSLKDILKNFPQLTDRGQPTPLWKMPQNSQTRDLDALGYVFTESLKEWEDQVQILAQLLVEGLNGKYINSLAEKLNCRDVKLGSGKQLRLVMDTLGIEASVSDQITDVFAQLWHLRSSAIAHVGRDRSVKSFSEHFKELLARSDQAMRILADMITQGLFVIPE